MSTYYGASAGRCIPLAGSVLLVALDFVAQPANRAPNTPITQLDEFSQEWGPIVSQSAVRLSPFFISLVSRR